MRTWLGTSTRIIQTPHKYTSDETPQHQGMTFGIVWKFLDDCIFRGQCPEMLMASSPAPSPSPSPSPLRAPSPSHGAHNVLPSGG